jgi:hypothetical protein
VKGKKVPDAHPMTCGGYANVFENLIIGLRQQVHVNFVDPEVIAVLAKTN